MNKKNIDVFIDFGSSKIRLGVLNKDNSSNNFFTEKKCVSNFDLNNFDLINASKSIKELVQGAEKKIGTHINDINLLIDTHNIFISDICIKKNFEGKKINQSDINYLIKEAEHLIQKNNSDKKIIHSIVLKYKFDEKSYFNIPSNDLECNYLTLEIKFIFFPILFCEKIYTEFAKNDLSIKNFLYSSYIKSKYYNEYFENYDKKFFLDIGYKKTSLIIFDKNNLVSSSFIPVGGESITKDISIIFKMSKAHAEKIKLSLYKSETTFSDSSEGELKSDDQLINESHEKISHELLKKVIHARVDEIINLSFDRSNFPKITNNKEKNIIIFTGEGSKILNESSIYLENKFSFMQKMNFFEETVEGICKSGENFLKSLISSEEYLNTKKRKKYGFFERLFHLFS